MSVNIGIDNKFLHENATTIGAGSEFSLSGITNLAIEITGTATASEVIFEAKIKDNWYSIMGNNVATGDVAISTTGKNEIWTFEVMALTHFRARVNSISGGNLIIYVWGVR